MHPNLQSMLTHPLFVGFVGFVLGLLAEPFKTWVVHNSEARLAKREMYDEIARYVAELERIFDADGKDSSIDFATYEHVTNTVPKLRVFNWYQRNRLDTLFRVDKKGGLRAIAAEFKDSRRLLAQTLSGKNSPEKLMAFVKVQKEYFDWKFFCTRKKAAHKKLSCKN